MNKINILGVNIDDISLRQATELVVSWLKENNQKYIVTPNPEFIMGAQKDGEFKEILNQADLAIPDGRGLKFASDKLKHTTTGVDLMEELIKVSSEKGFSVAFLGGGKGVIERLEKQMMSKYPKLKISYLSEGGKVDQHGDLIEGIDQIKAEILFVAFGQGKQEKWIVKNLHKHAVKVMMGVGGAFDYLSGEVQRAPVWIRKLGFEWLYRLIIQPWRIKRQSNLLKYLFLSLQQRLSS